MSMMIGASIESWPIEAVPEKNRISFFAKKCVQFLGFTKMIFGSPWVTVHKVIQQWSSVQCASLQKSQNGSCIFTLIQVKSREEILDKPGPGVDGQVFDDCFQGLAHPAQKSILFSHSFRGV